MMFLFLPDGPYIEPIAWTLVHFLWQGTIVALLLAAALRCLINASSSRRYLAGCIGLAIMAVCPMVTFSVALSRQVPSSIVADQPVTLPLTRPISYRPDSPEFEPPDLQGERGLLTDSANALVLPAEEVPDSVAQPTSKHLLAWLVVVWAIGVGGLSLRLFGSWLWIQRMKTLATSPISAEWSQSFAALAKRLEISRPARIMQSALVEVPTLIGWLRPTILLPIGFLTGMTPLQIEAILAHEFAHILRRDYLVNLLQTMVETVLFYHPAVWWVSGFIRGERENCCDDIAALVCGQPVEYARALTALEGFRQSHRDLVVAANHGSLLHRIQRIAGLPNNRADRPAPWAIPALVLLLVPLIFPWSNGIAALPPVEDALPGAAEELPADWGTPVNGAQCRIIPLPAAIDSEATDFQKTSSIFGHSQEMTFGVELKNNSEKTLQFAGVRYGDSFGPSSGKWNAESYGPLLFEFEFLDGKGIPIPRPERSYIQPMMELSGVSVHEILPGQSFKAVLRPGRFAAPMANRLPSGPHQVRVRYLGVPEGVLAELKKHWPKKPIAMAWTGPVLSNTISFDIKAPKSEAKMHEPAWGPETRGLRAAVQLRQKAGSASVEEIASIIPFNTVVEPVLLVKNTSKEPISFMSETWRQDDRVFLKAPDGNETELNKTWYSGWPTLVQWRLKPGEMASLESSPIAFLDNPQAEKKLDHPVGKTILAKKGTYQIRFAMNLGGIRIGDPKEKVEIPPKKDWTGILPTGSALLTIRDREALDGAQTLRDLSLDTWRIVRLTGKSIGLATMDSEKDSAALPLRVVVDGPGSLQLGPLPAKEPSPSAASGPTFRIEAANGIFLEKSGPFRFKGKVKVDFQPKEAGDGPAFQMVCDELQIDPALGAVAGGQKWSAKAHGQISLVTREIQAQGATLFLDWSSQILILEGTKDHPARLIMDKGAGEITGSCIQLNLKKQKLEVDRPTQSTPPSAPLRGSTDEKLRWNWKGTYTGGLVFVDPNGKPITQGTFSARLVRKSEPSAEGPLTGSVLSIPDCDGQPLFVTVRAPGFEERAFSDIDVKPMVVKQIKLTPAVPARFRIISSVDKKPVKGVKVRFFNKTSDEAGGGPFPMKGIEGPIWQTTQEDGVATLDSLQKVDPNYPNLGNAVYFFYLEPPAASSGLVGRFVGGVRAGADLGTIELTPAIEIHGEIRGTKEQLDHFAAEWDQPFEQITANPKALFSYAVSKTLETERVGDHLVFHLKNLSPGKLRFVANFDPPPHSVSHVYARREAKGTDIEMSVEIKSPSPKLIITPKGLKKEI